MSSTPHDALFKDILGRPEHARGALRSVVPVAMGEALDWPTLAPVPGNFIDPALRERFTDALFSVTWRGGGAALVYVVFEHQSTVDDRMAFRFLRYMVRIWERWLKDHPKARALPLIIPVVLYHGAEPWSAPVSLDALLDIPGTVRPAIAEHLPRFTYVVDDLSEVPDEQLRARAMTALGKLVAVCFKYARTRSDFLEILSRWANVVREAANAPKGSEAFTLVMHYILVVSSHVQRDDLRSFVHRVAGPEAEETVMTAGERLIQQGEERGLQRGLQEGMQQGLQEGMQQGLQEGMQQGLQEGIQQGERALLLRLLRKRFGTQVDADTERRVEAASPEQVATWAERVLSATTLQELLAG